MRFHILLALILIPQAIFAQTTQPTKKLIEFGWDEPNTTFMQKHIAEMEQTPFDGTVFNIQYGKPDGTRGDFLGEAWGTRKFTDEELKPAVDELKKTPFKKFASNFLRFDVTPGDVDWFDPFDAITHNANRAAKVAREGKARGILFDIEQYNKPLWDYSKQRDAKTKSWDAYAARAKQRGRDVMSAFQKGFGDDVVVFMTFGYSLPYSQTGNYPTKLPTVSYGLLKPFLDGMFESAKPGAKIVDGFEISYGYKTAQQFAEAETMMHKTVLPYVADAEKYKQFGSLGFGLWLDYDWRKNGWDAADVSKNYFKPDEFAGSLKLALQTCDEYVWIYTEKPQWWSQKGKVLLPDSYVEAIRKAREN